MPNITAIPEFKFETYMPAVIEFNYRELSDALDAHLEKYENLKVTEETLSENKKLAQELGSQAKAISRIRIDRKNELTEPVSQFESMMKSLEGKIATVQAAINVQVKAFESEKLASIAATIREALADQAKQEQLRQEFCNFDHDAQSLVKLTAVTAKGSLSAKTNEEVKSIVRKAASAQAMVDLRLARLEAECYRLGLAAPLNQAHVNHILMMGDEQYQAALEKIIAAELVREEKAVAAHRGKIEAEAKLPVAESVPLTTNSAPELAVQSITHKQVISKTVVTCTFEIDASDAVPTAAIESKFRAMLESAGFTTLSSIKVQRPQKAA